MYALHRYEKLKAIWPEYDALIQFLAVFPDSPILLDAPPSISEPWRNLASQDAYPTICQKYLGTYVRYVEASQRAYEAGTLQVLCEVYQEHLHPDLLGQETDCCPFHEERKAA